MISNKSRSFTAQDGDPDVTEAYGNQTLPVAVLPHDFDGIPLDGSQYLATVRASADLLPSYFYVANPYASDSNEISIDRSAEMEGLEDGTEDDDEIPSEEWRETFVERFLNMREAIRNTPAPPINPSAPASKANFPSTGDKNAWYHFIFRAKVSSLVDTTVTTSQTSDVMPEGPQESFHCSDHTDEQLKEKDANGPPVDGEDSNPQPSVKVRPGDSSTLPVKPDALSQVLEEESEIYAMEQSKSNPLKRKAPGEEAREGGSESISEAEREERRRQKKAMRHEPRSLRFPSPSLMRRFDSQTALDFIGHITEWILSPTPSSTDSIAQATPTSISNPTETSNAPSSSTAVSDFLSLWTFSLLSELDRNLLSDEISVLRELVRSVIEALKLWRMRRKLLDSMKQSKRKEKDQEDQDVVKEDPETGAWMIIAIVVGVWGQMDLWEDARAALRSV